MTMHNQAPISAVGASSPNLIMSGSSIGRRAAAAEPPPIRIALHGFSDRNEAVQIVSLFSRANRWQQPWEVVTRIADAGFLLVAADSPEELAQWHGYEGRFSREHLIAYSSRPFEEARWHLRRPSGAQAPSPLEFTLLLKEIGGYQSTGRGANLPGTAPSSRPTRFDWRERLKVLIVGSVSSGKTTAISTLSGGRAVSTEAVPSDHTQLRKNSTTVAMDFCTLAFDEETQLLVYGAPGQRRFNFMSEILIHKAMGIIVLVSNEGSNPLTELNYYLDAHREFLRRHRAVIGVTHNDISPNPSLAEYNRFLESRGESWPVLKVDARKREDMLKLVSVLVASTLKHG